mmetsp:Transcript_26711/g.47325  ORF Transcript_26711/g.47325 Transcript_26711/m.47325 type:complete len:303 (-) Transcript_26711:53-961(-)
MSDIDKRKTMSLRYMLTVHLNDYQQLIEDMLSSVAEFEGKNAAAEVCKKAESILAKDMTLQETVQNLIKHKRLQNEISRLKEQIRQEDDKIINFTTKLASLEQKLHDAATEEKRMVDLDGNSRKQNFSAYDVLVFAERLGQLSAQGYQETYGYTGFHRPPAPQPKEMQVSKLRLSLDQLIENEFAVPPDPKTGQGPTAQAEQQPQEAKQLHVDDSANNANQDSKVAGDVDGSQSQHNQAAKQEQKNKDADQEDDRERTTFQDFMPFLSAAGTSGDGDDDDSSDLEDEEESAGDLDSDLEDEI